MKFYTGRYRPLHPEKYRGDTGAIIYRSSWERVVMKWLDTHPSVLWWGSESFPIPYMSPVDGKIHKYFPDMIVRFRRKDQTEKTYILEIKPSKETTLRPAPQRSSRAFLREALTYSINTAKWEAAQKLCLRHGWQFVIITEQQLPGLV